MAISISSLATRPFSKWMHAATILAALLAPPRNINAAEPVSAKPPAKRLARVFLLDAESLAHTRERIAAGEPQLAAPLKRLRRDADEALKLRPPSVMDKQLVPPSGNKHDYMSLGPYWWPDPDKPDGLPYIRRDGRVNPEGDSLDRKSLGKMSSAVETLALAYYLTGHEPYAQHAARLLRVWFLDDATRMHPHLKYGQAIPGLVEGRGIGIIDTPQLARVADAVGLLAGSGSWTAADQQGILDWYREYLTWLIDSGHGRDESRTKNNHGTWYDVQVAAFALLVGEDKIAHKVLRQVPQRRIATQIEPDGRQPHELSRTRSFDYSVMNLRGMFELATLAPHVGVELANFTTPDGRGIRPALDWLLPFALGESAWSHEQLVKVDGAKLAPLLRRASLLFHDPRYEKALQSLDVSPDDRLHLLWPAAR